MRFYRLGQAPGEPLGAVDDTHGDEGVLLRAEVEHLRHEVTVRSRICMAEGAVAVLGHLPVEQAAAVLRDVAHTLGLDLHRVAEHVLTLVQGTGTPTAVVDELRRALDRA
ncbi:ANTAR domain-containing protein [Streptomyces sp. 900105245]